MPLRRVSLVIAIVLASLAAARGDGPPKNPLEDAREGEWMVQRSTGKYGESALTYHWYLWVSKVEGRKVTVMVQALRNENLAQGLMAANPVTRDLDAAPGGGKPTVSEEELEVKGKKLRCTRLETVLDTPIGKQTTTSWESNELPVYGEVRRVVRDKDGKEVEVIETLDWGAGGGAERPVG